VISNQLIFKKQKVSPETKPTLAKFMMRWLDTGYLFLKKH